MNDLQMRIFDIFKCFIAVCERLNLKYYLVHGSALGAVKYQGFIPWDDDFDVAMSRKDYEIFIQEAQKFLPQNIFLQNYKTDKNFLRNFSKLRDSNTTFIETTMKDLDINHGVFLDIFPLDAYPERNRLTLTFKIKEKFYKYASLSALEDKSSYKIRLRNTVFRFFGFHKHIYKYFSEFENLILPFKSQAKYYTDGFFYNKNELFGISIFGEGIMAKFEGIDVRIPSNYDAYLTQKYGDWRADLPDDEKYGHHFYTVCDLNKPYTEYIKK